MEPKRILVHMERDREWSPHLDIAMILAKQFGAHVHGIVGFVEAVILRSYFAAGADILREERKKAEVVLETRRQRLKAEGDKYGVPTSVEGIEWDTAGALSLAGRFFDLIIVGKTRPDGEDNEQDISGECLRSSGRPVLIVPRNGKFEHVGKRILIAWNGSREAALALQAAYPFLKRADKVVLALSKTSSKYDKAKSLTCLDVEDLLRAHDVEFEVASTRIADHGAGEEIVRLSKEYKCDLIVMGSFGRSWLRDWVLGSATSAAQHEATVPILTQN